MNRRDALKNVSLIMGGTMLGANAFLSGCRPKGSSEKSMDELFTTADINLLDEIGETILPETEIPGAKAVNIGTFIAMMVVDTYEDRHQQVFKDGLQSIRSDFENQYGHSFMKGNAEERHAFLNELNTQLYVPTEDGKGDTQHRETDPSSDDPDHYFRMLKELTILGYFSSEIGSTQALRYVETPGRYEACIPYKEGDRAWSI